MFVLRLYLLFPVDICRKNITPHIHDRNNIYRLWNQYNLQWWRYTKYICKFERVSFIPNYQCTLYQRKCAAFKIVYDYNFECLQHARNQAKWISPNLAYESHGDHFENMMHVPNHFLRSQFRLFCRRFEIAKVKMNITYPWYWFEWLFETSMKIPA